MRFLRLRQRFAAWLALLAMVAGALAPTLAQAALAGQDRDGWVEVCSASGMVWVQADEADNAAGEAAQDAPGDRVSSAPDGSPVAAPGADRGPGHDAASHCPWCSLHGGAAGLPPPVWQADLKAPAGAAPMAPPRAIAWPGIWAVAQARAPPPAA